MRPGSTAPTRFATSTRGTTPSASSRARGSTSRPPPESESGDATSPRATMPPRSPRWRPALRISLRPVLLVLTAAIRLSPLAQAATRSDIEGRVLRLLEDSQARGAVLVPDVRTGDTIASVGSGRDPSAPVLPLSLIKLYAAALWWDHGMGDGSFAHSGHGRVTVHELLVQGWDPARRGNGHRDTTPDGRYPGSGRARAAGPRPLPGSARTRRRQRCGVGRDAVDWRATRAGDTPRGVSFPESDRPRRGRAFEDGDCGAAPAGNAGGRLTRQQPRRGLLVGRHAMAARWQDGNRSGRGGSEFRRLFRRPSLRWDSAALYGGGLHRRSRTGRRGRRVGGGRPRSDSSVAMGQKGDARHVARTILARVRAARREGKPATRRRVTGREGIGRRPN